MVLKVFAGKTFCENDQKSRKSRNLIPANFNNFKVETLYYKYKICVRALRKTPLFLPVHQRYKCGTFYFVNKIISELLN